MSGADYALQSLETSFHQDLNGDGLIGLLAPTVIEANGSTSLTEAGNHFFLYDGGGSGPSLKYAGADYCGGSIWRLDANRRGADGKRVSRLPGRSGRRSVYGLEHRQQRQLHLTNIGVVSGAELCVAIARDQLPPGLEWRRADRSSHHGDRLPPSSDNVGVAGVQFYPMAPDRHRGHHRSTTA